ncbi:MAG: tyrosine-type recombinase/integrase [Planctomycetota bacterium]
MKKHQIPKYRKQTGARSPRAFVQLYGKRYYLGKYGTPESKEQYRRLLAELTLNDYQMPVPSEEITIVELIARFWRYAQNYYRKPNGSITSEPDNYRQALRPLKELYGNTKVSEFGPMALKAVRQTMILRGWARTNINKMTSRLKRVFRWGTENELVPPDVFHALQAVSGLKRGRTEARETKPIEPVPEVHIEAIHPYVSRQIWTLVQLQLLTAARSGELVKMRSIDLNMNGQIWIYSPSDHKTAHHGYERTIYIGPQAQHIIQPFLENRPIDALIFSPSEAEAVRQAIMHKNRKTPLSCGNKPGTNCKIHPKRRPGQQYSQSSYRRAIRRACEKANIPYWHPHQLRHNAATRLRAEFGLEAAQLILGHSREYNGRHYPIKHLIKLKLCKNGLAMFFVATPDSKKCF